MREQELTSPLETSTRKKIDLQLSNLGWIIDEENKKCNVFTGRAKTTEQNKRFSKASFLTMCCINQTATNQ